MQKKNLAGKCVALGLVSVMALSSATACAGGKKSEKKGGIKHFTMFTAMTGTEINDDNEIKKIIADINNYDSEIMYPLAQQNIEIDLDDGVKTNYVKFGKALEKIAGLDKQED